MRIPEYKTCQENVELGQATALEQFIYEWEPLMRENALVWRSMLEKAVSSNVAEKDLMVPICDERQIFLPLEQEPE